MTERSTLDPSSADFFEQKYQERVDPWNFGGSAYELGRYDVTMRALAGRQFHHTFEPGCSVGVLTERLARISSRVDAIDLSPTAIAAAHARCAGLDHVHFSVGSVTGLTTGPMPGSPFDLIVLSEIGYYLHADELALSADAWIEALVPGGWMLGVHWLGHSVDHRLSGDQVHALLGARKGIVLELSERHTDSRHAGFRIDRWRRP